MKCTYTGTFLEYLPDFPYCELVQSLSLKASMENLAVISEPLKFSQMSKMINKFNFPSV